MSYIDEICGYLLQRGYVTREEISKLIKEFGESPELLDENDGEVDERPKKEKEPNSVHAGVWKPKSRRRGGRFGGRRTSGGSNVKITAPELDAKLPTLDFGDKLKQFLALLQWIEGTGSKESEWSWEAFVKETDKFYEMDLDGLPQMLKAKGNDEIRHHLDLLVLYCHQWLLLPDTLDGYVGAVVAAFNSEMGDFHTTEWTVNKHAWIYRYPNIRTMKRAVIVHNRLRHALVYWMKNIVSILYLVVDLTTWNIRYSVVPPNWDDKECRTTELWLRKIPRGSFVMGSPESEVGHCDNETSHHVTLTQDFYIGVFECTQRQWELVMEDDDIGYHDTCRPAVDISYSMIRGKETGMGWPVCGHAVDSSSFMGRLREKTGLMFDLPTEAQWEYACRAGTTTALNSGKNLTSIEKDESMDELGRYSFNESDGKGGWTSFFTKVGSYKPNGWSLYDMHGNVWEWCLDWYGDYKTAASTDPTGPDRGEVRIIRGGCYWSYAKGCRSAYRFCEDPLRRSIFCRETPVGFRVVCLSSDR